MSRLTPSGRAEVWPVGASHERRKETDQGRPTKLDGAADNPTNRHRPGSECLVARSLSAWRFRLGSHGDRRRASLTGLRLHERPSTGRALKTPEFVDTASPGAFDGSPVESPRAHPTQASPAVGAPPGSSWRAPGRFRNRGGCRGYPGPVRALGLVLEPGRGWWCPLQVPIQHEPTDHINGGPLHGRMDAVEEWITRQGHQRRQLPLAEPVVGDRKSVV